MAFAFAVAALLSGRLDAAWARWSRPWTTAAWCFLTIGIALGSWWAYYELGWGGFWFWDPVENASLMPWLAGTALLHSATVVEKRDTLKAWTVLLAIIAFSLSLMGTFIVRSGVLTSVHAFATDPTRGVFILALLAIAVGGALILFAYRAPALAPGGLFAPISREGSLVLNNLLLATACATVFLGTLYPLFVDVLELGKVSVGPPYFNATFLPLMAPVLIAMGVGPMLAWKRGDLRGVLTRLWLAAAAAALTAVGVLVLNGGGRLLAALGTALAAWLFVAVVVEWAERVRLFRAPWSEVTRRARGLPRAAYGPTIAPAGLAMTAAGIVASAAWQSEAVRAMRIGDTVPLAGYVFRLDDVGLVQGPNYQATRARFSVSRDGRPFAVLEPEKRAYPVERQSTTEAAIHTTWLADLYAVIGDGNRQSGWTVRLYHNPLVPWIWVGAVVMTLGGLVSLTDRRHRVGAPARRRDPVPAAAPAG